MTTKKPQILLTLDKDLLNRIEDFRFGNRIPTRSDAIRRLLEAGLANYERDSNEISFSGIAMRENIYPGVGSVHTVMEILENEGFMVKYEGKTGEYQIIEHNCPYRNLGNKHPDICKLDQTLISTILDAPAQKKSCLLEGDSRCIYVVKTTPQPETE